MCNNYSLSVANKMYSKHPPQSGWRMNTHLQIEDKWQSGDMWRCLKQEVPGTCETSSLCMTFDNIIKLSYTLGLKDLHAILYLNVQSFTQTPTYHIRPSLPYPHTAQNTRLCIGFNIMVCFVNWILIQYDYDYHLFCYLASYLIG